MLANQIVSYLAAHEIHVLCADTGRDVTADLLADPMTAAVARIMAVFVQLDKEMTVAKLRKARERRRSLAKCLECGVEFDAREGHCPLGHLRWRVIGRCEGRPTYGRHPKYPEEAEVLADILRLNRDSFAGPTAIADALNARGIKTREGKSWLPATVSRILERESRDFHSR